MPLSVSPLLTAPQVTGHPHGLPDPQAGRGEPMRVKPIADARNPEARLKDGQAPTQFWRAVNGEPDPSTHTAPPSIMQITITRLLDAQAPRPEAPTEPDPETSEAVTEGAATSAPGRQAKPAPADPGAGQQPRADQPAEPPETDKPARRSVFSTLP